MHAQQKWTQQVVIVHAHTHTHFISASCVTIVKEKVASILRIEEHGKGSR